jgi:hypothetical protein
MTRKLIVGALAVVAWMAIMAGAAMMADGALRQSPLAQTGQYRAGDAGTLVAVLFILTVPFFVWFTVHNVEKSIEAAHRYRAERQKWERY